MHFHPDFIYRVCVCVYVCADETRLFLIGKYKKKKEI